MRDFVERFVLVAFVVGRAVAAFTVFWIGLATAQSDASAEDRNAYYGVLMQGRYAEALPLAKREMELLEKEGPDRPVTSLVREDLARMYLKLGRFTEAVPLLKRQLAYMEKISGREDPMVADSLDLLATVFKEQSRYGEAERLYKRALAIRKRTLDHGERPPSIRVTPHSHVQGGFAQSHINLASLYLSQGQYEKAKLFFERYLAIAEDIGGPDGESFSVGLMNLALVSKEQGHYGEAETLYKRALTISEKKKHFTQLCSVSNAWLDYTSHRAAM